MPAPPAALGPDEVPAALPERLHELTATLAGQHLRLFAEDDAAARTLAMLDPLPRGEAALASAHIALRGLPLGLRAARYTWEADPERRRRGNPSVATRAGRLHLGTTPARALGTLLGRLTYHLADGARDGTVLHSAGLARNGRAVAFPGPPEAGKSTLVAWCAASWGTWFTDEVLYVPRGALESFGLPRPLNARRGAMRVIRPLLRDGPDHTLLHWRGGSLIAPERLGARTVAHRATLVGLVFPRWSPRGPPSLRPIGPAEAAAELARSSLNGRNLPGHGIAELTRIAREVPAWSLRHTSYADLAPLAALIEALTA